MLNSLLRNVLTDYTTRREVSALEGLKGLRMACPGCGYNWSTTLVPEPGNPGGFVVKESNCPVCGKQGQEK
jgi:hypothetical protein